MYSNPNIPTNPHLEQLTAQQVAILSRARAYAWYLDCLLDYRRVSRALEIDLRQHLADGSFINVTTGEQMVRVDGEDMTSDRFARANPHPLPAKNVGDEIAILQKQLEEEKAGRLEAESRLRGGPAIDKVNPWQEPVFLAEKHRTASAAAREAFLRSTDPMVDSEIVDDDVTATIADEDEETNDGLRPGCNEVDCGKDSTGAVYWMPAETYTEELCDGHSRCGVCGDAVRRLYTSIRTDGLSRVNTCPNCLSELKAAAEKQPDEKAAAQPRRSFEQLEEDRRFRQEENDRELEDLNTDWS